MIYKVMIEHELKGFGLVVIMVDGMWCVTREENLKHLYFGDDGTCISSDADVLLTAKSFPVAFSESMVIVNRTKIDQLTNDQKGLINSFVGNITAIIN